MNPLEAYEAHESEISTDIVDTLRNLGDEAIHAYASVGLYHNTLSRFVPSIQYQGLLADSDEAAPQSSDIDFATKLFEQKGFRYPASQRQFDVLIKGTRDDREPGIFFYPLKEPAKEFRAGYGVPERMHILAMEMGYVMLYENGPYNDDERQEARTIFERYRDVVSGDSDAHVAVIKANPFNPQIINHRLKDLAPISRVNDPENVIQWLGKLGFGDFEGVYVPGPIVAADLMVMDARLPILSALDESSLDPTRSRFFHTPASLKRI